MKIILIFVLFISSLHSLENFTDKTVDLFTKKYKRDKQVLVLWDKMIQKASQAKTVHKLKIVNDFFNTVRYSTDIRHWKKNDYWATPTEFVGTKAGDCEDYAIAKYFSLLKAGIPEAKLRIAYVKLLRRNTNYQEAHMVLLYFHKENSVPIVMDNVNKKLKLATKRADLKLIYSFNANGLWEAKNKGKSHVKRGSNKLKKWQTLMEKI